MNEKIKIPVSQIDVQPAANTLRSKSQKPWVALTRDIKSIRVPDGGNVLLTEGMQMRVTQALGSTFTIEIAGNLFRVDGDDGDAFNEEKRPAISATLLSETISKDVIIKILIF